MNDMTFLFFFSLLFASPGSATPVEHSQAHIIAREDSRDTSGFSPSVWIPIVIVILILSGLVLLSWSNRKLRRLIIPGNAQNQSQPTTELTAEQLAGTINNGAATANTNAPQPAARTRRTRRPRRTPSQMSVTSLPAYNKEPGEQELVIFRGQDMEDVTVPTTGITEEDGDSSLHSGEQSRQAYSPLLNESPNESPVAQSEDQRPSRTNSRRSSRRSSRNHDLPHSSEESRGLMQNEQAHNESLPHHREEAPPYFEVVDPEDSPNPAPTSASSPPNSAEPSTATNLPPPPSSPERRSGIRTFFNRMSVVGAPRGLGHARGDSNISYMSSHQSHGEPSSSASPSASRHRPSPSTASSFFRTLSRQRSQSTLHSANGSARLNSPSLISLNSISAPLTHTLTRTEIAYPKSGPTAEQLKIIASRESIARFGVPYGPDAVAFASTSMLDVNQPPPDFDSVIGPGSSSLSLNASMISLHARGDSSGSNRPMSPLARPAVTSSDENEGTRDSHNRPSFSSNAAHPLSVTNSPEPNQASSSATAESQQNETLGIVAGHPSVASKVSTTYKSIAPSTTSVSEFGKLGAPPSSFNYDQTAISSRSESRASVLSRQSYATAAESIATRGHLSETDSEDDDAPVNHATSTHSSRSQMPPGLGTTSSRHAQEATDATVVGNSSVSGAVSSNVSS